ncbi:hypothetical protein RUND412_001668 [Rhizina undulata]
MSPPDSQPSSLSARQARIAAMESRLDEFGLTTNLASITQKIEKLDGQRNGANAPQYYRLKAMKGDLKQEIDALSVMIAAERKAYEEDRESSVEKKVIQDLQKLIDLETE